MKLTILISILLLPLYLCSCGNQPYPHAMQTADSLVDIRPDSALSLLLQLKDSIDYEPEETQMYYRFLSIKAQDKAYITHTSDSTIRQVLKYYRDERDKKYLPEVLYYAGRVYTDLGDAPQALEYFQRAIEASKESTDYRLINRIYSQIGTLFLYQDVYEKALEMFRKSYQYSVLAKDSVGMVYSLRNIGRCFSTQEEMDSAIHYYKKADKLAECINNQELKSIINSELSDSYLKIGEYKKAYEALLVGQEPEDCISTPARNTVLARYYENTSQLDSAVHYYSLLLNIDSYLYKQEANIGLGQIARLEGKSEEALLYFDSYLAYTDSLQEITQTESVRKTNALYNYQLRQKENRKLKIQANQQKRLIIFLLTSLAFALVSFFAYRQYRQRKEQAKHIQQEKLRRIQKEQYQSSLAHIVKNKEQIKQLEAALLQATKDQLHHEMLKAQKELIERTNEQIEADQKVQQQSEQALLHSEIYKVFCQAAEGEVKIKECDWQELTHTLNESYNQFAQRLHELYPIKDIELQVCLLLKISMTPTQISIITLRSKQAITSIRKRLYAKVFDEESTPEQWDNFICEF